MGKKKTGIHIPKLRVGQYLFLFDIRYYFKISLTCSKFLIQTLRKMHLFPGVQILWKDTVSA